MPHNEKEKLLLPTGKNNNPTVFSNVHEKCQQSTNQVQKRYRNGFVSKKMYEKSISGVEEMHEKSISGIEEM